MGGSGWTGVGGSGVSGSGRISHLWLWLWLWVEERGKEGQPSAAFLVPL